MTLPGAAPGFERPWRGRQTLTSVALLLLLIAHLAARFHGYLWVGVYEPHTLVLRGGHVAEYETGYFDGVVTGMLGGSPPLFFTTANYRMWLEQLFVALLLRLLGDTYWAYAVTEIAGAWLGLVGMLILGDRLQFPRRVTLTAAVLFAVSPILAAYMWRNQLHVAAVGSMAFGAGFTAAVLLSSRSWQRRAVLLAGVWFTTSLLYQYHLVAIPAALGLALAERGERRSRVSSWLGALAGFGLLTVATRSLAARAGLPVILEGNDPQVMVQTFAGRFEAGGETLAAFLVGDPVLTLFRTYHPAMVVLAVLGSLEFRTPARWYIGSIAAAAYGFLVIRDLDRVAHAAYPAVYIGAALAVFGVPSRVERLLDRLSAAASARALVGTALRVALPVILVSTAAITNSDAWRDYRFVWSALPDFAPR
jgi:hypothetical protein